MIPIPIHKTMNQTTSYFAKTSSTPQKANKQETKNKWRRGQRNRRDSNRTKLGKKVPWSTKSYWDCQLCNFITSNMWYLFRRRRWRWWEFLTSLYCWTVESIENALNIATKFVTGGRRGDFNTNSGNLIIMGMPKEIDKAMKKKVVSDQSVDVW